LFVAACDHGIDGLSNECFKILEGTLSPENAIRRFRVAVDNNYGHKSEEIITFIKKNHQKVTETDGWEKLLEDRTMLKSLFQNICTYDCFGNVAERRK
jgi:hypothetical protein